MEWIIENPIFHWYLVPFLLEAVEASPCYFFQNWLMKLKCPNLLKPLDTIIQEKYQPFYPSEPFIITRFQMRHPVAEDVANRLPGWNQWDCVPLWVNGQHIWTYSGNYCNNICRLDNKASRSGTQPKNNNSYVYIVVFHQFLWIVQLREYWKDLEYRLHHRLSKFDRSVFLNLKPISYFLGIYMAWFVI